MTINEEHVKISKVVESFKAKNQNSFDRIAFVDVLYHELEIKGRLFRGQREDGNYFYFFCMPSIPLIQGKYKKHMNVNNWPSKELSDEFQKIVINKLIASNPQFFHEDYKKPNKKKKDE